jgi:hypothetical protein
MSLGNCHFATDKNTFYIREIAKGDFRLYIIGVLKVQRFKREGFKSREAAEYLQFHYTFAHLKRRLVGGL